ncbi:glycosyltransferase family 2 protein [Christensenellaceae bacterium OttesenSCG-928-K19]|nr:glycosyltransferase family 2 protein [Christensenellaceae bacterium OttesenSCG-928-K19]
MLWRIARVKLLVFIPAYNEELNIVKTVQNLQKHCPEYDYVVINDGSTDGTEQVLKENGFNYISLPFNLGLDGVFQTGNLYAYTHGYDLCVPFDGDGQHNAEYLPLLVKKIEEGYDIAIGSRFLTKKKHRSLRMAGSSLISFCFRLVTRVRFTDPTSGMRMVTRKIMKHIAYDQNSGAEPDSWAYFVLNGAKLAEIQVEMNEREQGTSYFTLPRSIFFMLRMCISILFIQFFRKGGDF